MISRNFARNKCSPSGLFVFIMPGILESDDSSRRNNAEVSLSWPTSQGDFGLRVTVASGSKPFDNCCRGHAMTDAHGLQAILRLAPLQLVDQLGHLDGAGCAYLPPAEGPRSTPPKVPEGGRGTKGAGG